MSINIPSQIKVRQEKGSWLRRSFSFLDNDVIVATLKYDNSYANKAHASVSGKDYSIQRRGFWRHYLTISSSKFRQNEIRVDLNWRGSMEIKDSNGQRFVFKSKGLWKPRWKWFDGHERTLIEIRSNQFSKKSRGIVDVNYPEMEDTLLWIVISWFVIVCSESDAVAVAVT